MKHIKTFESFLNEGQLPFDIEKALKLGGLSFEFDEEATEDDNDSRLDFATIYVAKERGSGAMWTIKAGTTKRGGYLLEIMEDETVKFTHEYNSSQRAYFDQDCMNSLGFIPELD